MNRMWVNGPGFVDWLTAVRPEAMSNMTESLGETNTRGLFRAKSGGAVSLDLADRICCLLFLHIDSEMPEELWTDPPDKRPSKPAWSVGLRHVPEQGCWVRA